MKILIVEDDQGLAELLHRNLTHRHYLVDVAPDGLAGLELTDAFSYDLILLDFILPKLDGISLCRQLRDKGDRTPILILTADDSSIDKVKGLDAGADDYVVKPFDFEELLARIRALLRRGNSEAAPRIEWGNLLLDPSSCEVTYGGQILPLTSKEYSLIELFLRNHQRIFSISSLLEHLWSVDDAPLENTVRAHIKSLRKKLKQTGGEDLIETVYGLGYRLRKSPLPVPTPAVAPSPSAHGSVQQPSPEFIQIWERHRQQYRDRIVLIETAIAALAQDQLDHALLQTAIGEAHTLIGALGGFGFETAAQISRDLEQTFKSGVSPGNVSELKAWVAELYRLIETPSTPLAPPISPMPSSIPKINESQLLIVSQDEAFTAALRLEATGWGIQGDVVTTRSQVRQAIAHTPPEILLLDLDWADSVDHCFDLLAELAAVEPPVPVVILSAQTEFMNRIKAARLGAHVFLQKPIHPTMAMKAIAGVLEQLGPPDAKILIVDDDPQVLDTLEALLTPWGFQLTLLQNPSEFWNLLSQTAPNLLILDIEMPELSGIDLCKVVRNEPEWSSLPILFLSAHQNSDIVHQVFVAGGDDYVNKPIIGPELVARILNRLNRTREIPKVQPTSTS